MLSKMGTSHRSGVQKRTNDSARLITTTIMGIVFGFFIGVSFPSVSNKIKLSSRLISFDGAFTDRSRSGKSLEDRGSLVVPKIYVPTNPRGAEMLPPGIVVPESDFYLRRLWGEPNEDVKKKPKYLVTFTVGFNQKDNINTALKKFSDDFQILLFHYDGRTSEWEQFEWSKKAIHVSVPKQTKWWYAKRFLHPDVVAAYEYIFIWDEDLGVEHFNADRYIQLVKKHGLEISQPGLEPNNGLTWEMTKRRGDKEVHKETSEKPGWCSDPKLPPCAAYSEPASTIHDCPYPLHISLSAVSTTLPTTSNASSATSNALKQLSQTTISFFLHHFPCRPFSRSIFSLFNFNPYPGLDLQSSFCKSSYFQKRPPWECSPATYASGGGSCFTGCVGRYVGDGGGVVEVWWGCDGGLGMSWVTRQEGVGGFGDLIFEPPYAELNHETVASSLFVEIMAPVFSREAWRCVWHMIQISKPLMRHLYCIQNDLVHGWGLDFALRRCVEPAHEKIGVVDSQWIIHKVIPSLGSQGKAENGKAPWQGVRERCKNEWSQFQNRLAKADKTYLAMQGKS
ncbi:hypothetical protein KSS87_003579 [Heliosperma pusillum]|nr:hypothetical protein KSS87_003579 [Heliosperma pusillum]